MLLKGIVTRSLGTLFQHLTAIKEELKKRSSEELDWFICKDLEFVVLNCIFFMLARNCFKSLRMAVSMLRSSQFQYADGKVHKLRRSKHEKQNDRTQF